MSNNPAGPTLAEGTIVERKGDDVTDRQVPQSIHFKDHHGERGVDWDQNDNPKPVEKPFEITDDMRAELRAEQERAAAQEAEAARKAEDEAAKD